MTIKVLRIFQKLDDVNLDDHFNVDQLNITRRQNSLKIIGRRSMTTETKQFLNPMVNSCNYLLTNVVDTTLLVSKKMKKILAFYS